MADETTYESEMNQTAHRPGMESVVNRGADARDQSGTREGARRTVAPPTQSAFGAASASDPAPAPAAKPAATAPDSLGTDIRGKAREQKMNDIIDKAAG